MNDLNKLYPFMLTRIIFILIDETCMNYTIDYLIKSEDEKFC